MQALLVTALQLYLVIIFVRIILSWFPIRPGTAMASVSNFTRSLTDPLLEPIRRILPPAGMFDFSPMVLMLAVIVLQRALAG